MMTFKLNEARVLVETFQGFWKTDSVTGKKGMQSTLNYWLNQGGLDRKHGVDGDNFMEKIESLSEVEAIDLLNKINCFWMLPQWTPEEERLTSVGLCLKTETANIISPKDGMDVRWVYTQEGGPKADHTMHSCYTGGYYAWDANLRKIDTDFQDIIYYYGAGDSITNWEELYSNQFGNEYIFLVHRGWVSLGKLDGEPCHTINVKDLTRVSRSQVPSELLKKLP